MLLKLLRFAGFQLIGDPKLKLTKEQRQTAYEHLYELLKILSYNAAKGAGEGFAQGLKK